MPDTERTTWQKLVACALERPEDRRNNLIATSFLLLWALAFVAASQLLKRGLLPPGALTYGVAIVPVALSVLAIGAYVRFLGRADELLRKIALEALALGFGGGFIATFGLDLAEKAGFGPFDISTPFLLMIVCYIAGFLAAARRYA